MRARDAVAVSALRSAIAALDNAEAVSVGAVPTTGSEHVAGTAVGLGAAEVPRRELTEGETTAVLEREIADRVAAAEQAEQHGATDHAARLRAEAAVLKRYVAV